MVFSNFYLICNMFGLFSGSLSNMCLISLQTYLFVIRSSSSFDGNDFLWQGGFIPLTRKPVLSPVASSRKTRPKDQISVLRS